MLRRPPTSIELKLEDVIEYENVRRAQESAKEYGKTQPTYKDPPNLPTGPKSRQEIQSRIGIHPTFRSSRISNLNNQNESF